MQITKEQNELLDSFKCERFSTDAANAEMIKSFTSERGASLVSYFMNFGMKEDIQGTTTYYIIKDAQNEIMMFFSLKCGSLFEPLLDEDEVKHDFQRLFIILQAIENANGDSREKEEAMAILTKYQVGDRISVEAFSKYLHEKKSNKKTFLNQLLADREREQNDKIFRVQNTHSGVELVHFCTNDNLREKWNTYKLGHPMGETLFWKFIAPKFFDVQEIVGCEYAFLFAADLSEDGSLVNYYDVSLKFQKRQDVGTNKPFYDFCCEFMCQEINEMRHKQKEFFGNFNIDAEDELI